MTNARDSILQGMREALSIARGEVTSPHETRISQHGERLVIRTIEYGVEVRCEIRRAPEPHWKTFFFDDEQGTKILVDSFQVWKKISTEYRSYNKSGNVSWLGIAQACPLSLHEDLPYFGFCDMHCGSLTLGEWAYQHQVNLGFEESVPIKPAS